MSRSGASVAPALALLLAACSPAGPGTSAGPSESPGPSGGAATVRTWSRLDEAIPSGTFLGGVAAVESRIVVVGGTGSGPFVATSTDAEVWTAVGAQESFVTEGGAGMSDLIATVDGLLAVGLGDSQTVVWASVDGLAWTKSYETHRLTQEEIAAGAVIEGGMSSVTHGARGYVAVGLTGPGLIDDFGGSAWFSRNGDGWVSIGPSASLLRAPLYDVSTLADGTFVAVGGARGAVALTSPDGHEWTLHEQRDALSQGQLRSVAPGASGGLVAVGGDDSNGFTATTGDGASWTRGPCTGALTAAQLRTIGRIGEGYVAAGSVNGRAAVWISGDGLTFSRVRADFGEGLIDEIFVDEQRMVAVGTQIWVGPPDGLGDESTYPASECGAPDPEAALPQPTPFDDVTLCVMVQGPYASADYPEGVPLCEDIGLGCELPDPAPAIVVCEIRPEPALPPAPS